MICKISLKLNLALLIANFLVADATSIPIDAAESSCNAMQILEVNPNAQLVKYLEQTSILYGLTAVLKKISIDEACYQQLKRLQQDILHKQVWALKVLDASGTKPDGFTYGNNFWLGSRELCESLKVSINNKSAEIKTVSSTTPFSLSYRMIYIEQESPFKDKFIKYFDDILQLGVCLPTDCSLGNIQALTTEYLNADLNTENEIFSISFKVLDAKDLSINESYYEKISFKIVCAYLVFTVLMIACAACLKKFSIHEASNNEEIRFMQMLRCFDLQTNFKKLFAINAPTNNEISVINGLHASGAGAIAVLHMSAYAWFTFSNGPLIMWYYERMSISVLTVDIFFVIGGVLRAYHFFNNEEQKLVIQNNNFLQNVGLFLDLLLQRLLRIAPVYYFLTLFGDSFFTYVHDVSIFHRVETVNSYQSCSRNGWRNFFFIQNFYKWNEMCLDWTWYLACEMQFYVFASLLLICYVKKPKIAKIIICFCLLGNILLTFHIILREDVTFELANHLTSTEEIYINPWVRNLPYVIGVIVGICLSQSPHTLVSIFHKYNFYIFTLAALSIIVYGTVKSLTSDFAAAAVYVTLRCFIALSVSYLILGEIRGSKGWAVRIMQAKIFQHFNRVSYAFYMLNPMLIILFYGMLNTDVNFTLAIFLFQFPGTLILIYPLAVLFALVVESPYLNLANLIKQKKLSLKL